MKSVEIFKIPLGSAISRQNLLAFHLLVKPTGAASNLDCKYCFFLSKEMLYPGSRFRMADELLEIYIRQLHEAQQGVPEVHINWQGGKSTLMGLDFYQRSEEYVRKYQISDQRVLYTIQTNDPCPCGSGWEFRKYHGRSK
jgi:serine-type anaerobic sulfatase-maturating enzyme